MQRSSAHVSTHRSDSRIRVRFGSTGGRTFVDRLSEQGALRLRLAKTGGCQGIVVNTGGGLCDGDRVALAVALDAEADVTLTTAAAEKVYRSSGRVTQVEICLDLAARSRIVYAPNETIFFDRARLRRSVDIDCAADATLVMAEMLQFGRVAHGETLVTGMLRDSWRFRRDGRLVYADEVAFDGHIGAILARRGVADGRCAVATVLLSAPDVARHLEGLRAALASICETSPLGTVEAGVSLRDGLIVGRILASSSERLRSAVAAAVGAIDGVSLPHYWD